MKGGIATMRLDFTSKKKFIDDVYRYFNDSRICSLAGDLSDSSYEIIHKTLVSSGLGGYAQLFNLAVNKRIYVYNKLESRFYCITLDDTDIANICERFFIRELSYLHDCESGIKISRTDGRVLPNEHPMSIYIGIEYMEDQSGVAKIKPFYFDLSGNDFKTVMDNFCDLLDSYISEDNEERYRNFFHTSSAELKAQNRKLCDDLVSTHEMKERADYSVVSGIECMSSRDYYDRCNGNPKFHPIISEPEVTPIDAMDTEE